jgi:hypothetical protein
MKYNRLRRKIISLSSYVTSCSDHIREGSRLWWCVLYGWGRIVAEVKVLAINIVYFSAKGVKFKFVKLTIISE